MLPVSLRLQKNNDFKKVYKRGRKVEGKKLVLYYGYNALRTVRFGFSISRKIGKATIRNRYKRILRGVCYNHRNFFKTGLDIVLVVKKDKNGLSYDNLENEVLKLVEKAKLLLKTNQDEKGQL